MGTKLSRTIGTVNVFEKREKVEGGWRKFIIKNFLINYKFKFLLVSKYYLGDKIKDEMGEIRSMERETCIQNINLRN